MKEKPDRNRRVSIDVLLEKETKWRDRKNRQKYIPKQEKMTAAQQEDSSCPVMMSFCRCDIFLLPKWWNLAGLEHNRQQLVTARLYVDWAWMLLTRFLSSMPYLKCLIDHSDALTLNYKQAHFFISMLGNRKENVSQLLCGKAILEGNFSQRLSETKMASDQDSRLDLGVRTRRWTVCWCCSDMDVHFLKWSYIKTNKQQQQKNPTVFSLQLCIYCPSWHNSSPLMPFRADSD